MIALDRPPSQVARVVRNQRLGGKRLRAAKIGRVDALRGGHEVVVEDVRQLAGRSRPADVLSVLPRIRAGFGRPRRVRLRVKCPVRQVQPFCRVGQGLGSEPVRREPAVAVPGADEVASLGLSHLERQERFRRERVLDLLVRHELGRPAEVAPLADLVCIEHRNRVAALAAHRRLLGMPSARGIRDRAQRLGEVVLDNDRAFAAFLEIRRRLGAAERADERLFGGIPVGLAPAGGAVVFRAGSRDRRAVRGEVRVGHNGSSPPRRRRWS